jgi:D-alanyl-D-alanine dipeptidase
MHRGGLLLIALAACSSRSPTPADSRPAAATPPPDAAPATPPPPPPDALPPPPSPLVDVATVIPDAVLDMRYATADNFTGAVIYPVARCLLHEEVAARLAEAAATLRDAGYRLVLWDCYRPHSVQHLLWDRVKDPRYVAEPVDDRKGRPVSGSVHSRAAAVDVSLADAEGAPLAMPTAHDHFGREAHRGAKIADPAVKKRYRALDAAMTAAGFEGLPTEWWHYGIVSGRYPLLDVPLL